ncbi:MAG: outer membrane protein assembly complex, YaeT protein [Acidobacteria bacterium]|nr:outer membrane protein assembly complex, YaeT protein [Acidobacteriota bacterium]
MTTALALAVLLGCAMQEPQAPSQPEPRQEQPEPKPAPGWLRWPPEDAVDRSEPERGFFPLVGTVVPGSGMSLGGGYRDYGVSGSPFGFEASALASRFAYQAYRVHLGLLRAHRHALDLRPPEAPTSFTVDDRQRSEKGVAVYLDARYRYLPRARFYGIGPDSQKADRTDYLVKGGAIDLAVQDQLTPALGLAARAGVLDSRVDEGHDDDWPGTEERFTPDQAPGLLDPPRYLVAGLAAAYDSREETHGGRTPLEAKRAAAFVSAAAWRYDDTKGDRYDFTRLALDGRAYVAAPGPRAVVALRALVSTDLTRDAGEVPVFLLATLGGSRQLRAFGNSRWQDRAIAYGTVEYRWRVHRFIEVAPFLETGTVARGLSNLDGRHFKTDGGIGLRARWRDYSLGRMDVARGSEGWRVVFDVGPVF